MKPATQRAIVYPKDVQRITGKSERYGRLLLQKIREEFSKEGHQFVTVDEFSQYTGLSNEVIYHYIKD